MLRFIATLTLALGMFSYAAANSPIMVDASMADVLLLLEDPPTNGGNAAQGINPEHYETMMDFAAIHWNSTPDHMKACFKTGALVVVNVTIEGRPAYDLNFQGTILCLFEDSL